MPHSHALSSLNHAIRHALLGAALFAPLGASLLPTIAQARDEQALINFSIPAGNLASALNAFARSAGVTLSFDPQQVRERRSAGLNGRYNEAEALSRLLAGSGLQAARQSNGSYILIPASSGALELDATTVSGLALGTTTEGTGSYTTGASTTATKLPLSIRETPQTITVVTRQQMDDQGATSISDVLNRTPGITSKNYDSDRWEFAARGFTITNYQYDGVNTVYDGVYDDGVSHTDMAIYDHVEVLKGATGLMTGAGDPSATVNLVRKRPTREFQASITGAAGSWDNYRTEGDIAGPLNDAGTLRGRFVGVYQDRNAYLDDYQQKKDVLYGILEADLTPDTLFTFGLDHQNITPRGSTWTGFPIYFSDGSRTDFSRSFNPATDWSRREFETQTTFASLEHRLASDWKLKASYNRLHSEHDTFLASASGGNPAPVTGEGMFMYIGKFKGDRVQNNLDLNASGPFSLLGREHEAVVGYMVSAAKEDSPWYGSVYPPVPGSIFDWHGEFPKPDIPRSGHFEINQRQNGLYGATRLKPTDELSVILGARVSTFKYDETYTYFDQSVNPNTHASYEQHGVVTPYAGVVYDLTPTYSLYASYTNIYQPQINKDASGTPLDPVEGDSYEAGIKGEYLDGRVNASLALFRIEQDNIAELVSGWGPTAVYRAVEGSTSKGVEFEIEGELLDGWNLGAGYTYNHTRDANNDRVYASTLMTTNPEHLARLFTTYRLPGELNRLTVGGGVSWQSEFYGKVFSPTANDYTQLEQDSYALVDLMARYRFNEHLSSTLNVKNLFDKKYLTGLGYYDTGFYGEPRSVLLTTKWDF